MFCIMLKTCLQKLTRPGKVFCGVVVALQQSQGSGDFFEEFFVFVKCDMYMRMQIEFVLLHRSSEVREMYLNRKFWLPTSYVLESSVA